MLYLFIFFSFFHSKMSSTGWENIHIRWFMCICLILCLPLFLSLSLPLAFFMCMLYGVTPVAHKNHVYNVFAFENVYLCRQKCVFKTHIISSVSWFSCTPRSLSLSCCLCSSSKAQQISFLVAALNCFLNDSWHKHFEWHTKYDSLAI